jgi:hypothetical protein
MRAVRIGQQTRKVFASKDDVKNPPWDPVG